MKIHDVATYREYAGLVERLRRARVDAGLSQAALAQEVGIERSMVSKYETGQRRLDILELVHILKVLRVAPGTFFAPDAEVLRPAPRILRLASPPRSAAPRSRRRRTRVRAGGR